MDDIDARLNEICIHGHNEEDVQWLINQLDKSLLRVQIDRAALKMILNDLQDEYGNVLKGAGKSFGIAKEALESSIKDYGVKSNE